MSRMSHVPGARLIGHEFRPRGVTHFCAESEFAGLLAFRFPLNTQDAHRWLTEQGRCSPDENRQDGGDGIFADGQVLLVFGKPVDHVGSPLSLSRISFRWLENKGGFDGAVAQQIAMCLESGWFQQFIACTLQSRWRFVSRFPGMRVPTDGYHPPQRMGMRRCS